jgi:hypothetical protein
MEALTAADFEFAIKLLENASIAVFASTRSAVRISQLDKLEQQAVRLSKRHEKTYGAAMAPAAFSKLLKTKVGSCKTSCSPGHHSQNAGCWLSPVEYGCKNKFARAKSFLLTGLLCLAGAMPPCCWMRQTLCNTKQHGEQQQACRGCPEQLPG